MKHPKKPLVDIRNATIGIRSSYAAVIQKIIEEGLCPFCEENLFRHHTRPVLFKGTHWIVTENAWPYPGTRHHFLLIGRKHVENLEKMSPAGWSELQQHFKKLRNKYKLKGATLLFRSGETTFTGASVQHLHAQIIVGSPRLKKSKAITASVGFHNG